MIFVTVGTHEQPFDRLIAEVDRLKSEHVITEDVMIQTGVSNLEPASCRFSKYLPSDEMDRLMKEAHIVITHGGPSSFMPVVQHGRMPIVVPRREAFHEHVNDHQVRFCHEVEKKYHNILLVDRIEDLADVITHYDELSAQANRVSRSHTAMFNREFEQVVNELFAEKRRCRYDQKHRA